MLVVVDANVIISALISRGTAFKVFFYNSILKKFRLIAPEFLIEEIEKHKKEILELTKLSERDLQTIFRFLMSEITIIPAKDFIRFYSKAKEISPHQKDAPYIALAMAFNCKILSGDKGLQSSFKNVITPREALDMLMG